MTLMKQTVTLEIVYDDEWSDHPHDWDFYGKFRLTPPESIEIVKTTTPERISDES